MELREYTDKEVSYVAETIRHVRPDIWQSLINSEKEERGYGDISSELLKFIHQNKMAENLKSATALIRRIRKFIRIELNLPI